MIDNENLFRTGLCSWTYQLLWNGSINIIEEIILINYIKDNRPSPISSFDALIHMKNRYYWRRGDIKPRIKWLKKHIAKN